MMIFRILCGEWIEPLWDCMRAEEKVCFPIWIIAEILYKRFKILHNTGRRINLLCHISADSRDGKLYGFKFVLGLAA